MRSPCNTSALSVAKVLATPGTISDQLKQDHGIYQLHPYRQPVWKIMAILQQNPSYLGEELLVWMLQICCTLVHVDDPTLLDKALPPALNASLTLAARTG